MVFGPKKIKKIQSSPKSGSNPPLVGNALSGGKVKILVAEGGRFASFRHIEGGVHSWERKTGEGA